MANGTVNRRGIAFVPPGGFAGFAQQTPATQALLRTRNGARRNGAARKTRRKKKAASSRPARARKARGKSRAVKFVKGSAAAKRHMAKLRKMRRK